jgi:hypothetical protein
MIECSGLFSKEIAFDGSESGFAVARTMLFPLRHNADADPLRGANEEGTVSSSEAASPRSRLQIKQRRELLLSESDRPSSQIDCAIEEPLEMRRGPTHRVDAEFVASDRLLAGLTLRQVHPRKHAVADRGKPSCSSLIQCISRVSVSVLNVSSPFAIRPGRTVRRVHAASPDTLHDPIETLFTELARRRLRNLVAKENS